MDELECPMMYFLSLGVVSESCLKDNSTADDHVKCKYNPSHQSSDTE